MGALTVNRKRGLDHYSSNYINPSLNSPSFDNRLDTHVSKKPKISPFTKQGPNQQPVVLEKVKSRVFSYPEPVKIKREIHGPCRPNKFTFVRSRSSSSRVFEEDDYSDDIMVNNLWTRYDQEKMLANCSLRYYQKVIDLDEESSKRAEVIDLDEESSKRAEVIDVDEESADKDGIFVGPSNGLVEIIENGVHEMEIEFDDGKVVESELEPATADSKMGLRMEIEKDETMSDLLSLNAKKRLMGIPIHKELLDMAERRNPKLSDLDFQIQFTEKKWGKLQLSRPKKQPEEEVVPDEVLREPFVPLTEEEEAEVSRAFNTSNRRKVLVTHDNSNIAITVEVLQCLRPKTWLNDEVINVYLELLKERERREPKKFLKCHFFNTFFYKKLTGGKDGYDFKSVRRWTTKRKLGYNLIECEKIFVPVHKPSHWCLAVINKRDKKFQYLDSLKGTDPYVLDALARYYVEEVKDKSGEDIDVSSWEQEYVEDLPAQKNGYDCGVFMVKYTDFYSRGMNLCFGQNHMPYFRTRTAKEILRLKAE